MTSKPQDGSMPDIIYLIHHADGEGEHAWSTDPDPTGFIQENEVTKYIREDAFSLSAAELDKIRTVMALYRSMLLSGERENTYDNKMFNEAFEILNRAACGMMKTDGVND